MWTVLSSLTNTYLAVSELPSGQPLSPWVSDPACASCWYLVDTEVGVGAVGEGDGGGGSTHLLHDQGVLEVGRSTAAVLRRRRHPQQSKPARGSPELAQAARAPPVLLVDLLRVRCQLCLQPHFTTSRYSRSDTLASPAHTRRLRTLAFSTARTFPTTRAKLAAKQLYRSIDETLCVLKAVRERPVFARLATSSGQKMDRRKSQTWQKV